MQGPRTRTVNLAEQGSGLEIEDTMRTDTKARCSKINLIEVR